MSNMKDAGQYELRYMDYMSRHKVDMITHISLPLSNSQWKDLRKVQIPIGKKAYLKCPSCGSDDWSDDSFHLKGFSCRGCGLEILAHTER